jgi:hypothetical protein
MQPSPTFSKRYLNPTLTLSRTVLRFAAVLVSGIVDSQFLSIVGQNKGAVRVEITLSKELRNLGPGPRCESLLR